MCQDKMIPTYRIGSRQYLEMEAVNTHAFMTFWT